MQESHQFIRIHHIPDPGIPRAVLDAVSEAGEHEDHGDDGEGRVQTGDDVGDELAEGTEDRDAGLAVPLVDGVDEQGREGVAREGAEEEAGDDGVGEGVVGFELGG